MTAADSTSLGWREWVDAARPRGLAIAIVPVAVGTVLGRWINALVSHALFLANGRYPYGIPAGIIWWRAIVALVVAVGIQVGTTFANDYAEGIRAPEDQRAGSPGLVASGRATADQVRLAAVIAYGIAAFAGIALAAASGWWLLAVGAACIAAGVGYANGPRPYGALGLGEGAVFGFFGVVATMGSTYVQVGRITLASFVASLSVGFAAMSVLEANNLRDLAADQAKGKQTLAVRLGRPSVDWLYIGSLMAAAFGVGVLAHWRPFVLLGLLVLPLAVTPGRAVLNGAEGRKLLPVVSATSQIQIALGVLVTLGILL